MSRNARNEVFMFLKYVFLFFSFLQMYSGETAMCTDSSVKRSGQQFSDGMTYIGAGGSSGGNPGYDSNGGDVDSSGSDSDADMYGISEFWIFVK